MPPIAARAPARHCSRQTHHVGVAVLLERGSQLGGPHLGVVGRVGNKPIPVFLASLSLEDRAIVRPAEAPNGGTESPWAGRGQNCDAEHRQHDDAKPNGTSNRASRYSSKQLYGESGPRKGTPNRFWAYQHLDRPNYLRVNKYIDYEGCKHFYQSAWDGKRWTKRMISTYAERKIPYRLLELKAALANDPDVSTSRSPWACSPSSSAR